VAVTSIRPEMQTVVTCVYDMVQSKPGVLSMDVYSVGTEKYVIEYKFREMGRIFTGGIGLHDLATRDGKHLYTNDTPGGQADNSGIVELDFLGGTIEQMYDKCGLMPGFDDTIKLEGEIDPPWQKIDMPVHAN